METWSAHGAFEPAKPSRIIHLIAYNKAGYIKEQRFSSMYISWTSLKSIQCLMLEIWA